MASSEPEPGIHDDVTRFVEAIQYTAAETGFGAQLIEKDYFCSLVLDEMKELFSGRLVFKGGTSLSKIHNDFYRLSEDLDFMISVPADAIPSVRRSAIDGPKSHVLGISKHLPCITAPSRWNDSEGGRRHHSIDLEYLSRLTGESTKIKFEISLRGEIITPVEQVDAKTLLLDPITRARALGPVRVKALSLRETYAEKVCAALTRRELAIRDYYDLDHAVKKGLIRFDDEELLKITRLKVAAPYSDPINEDSERLSRLRSQLQAELRPVLRPADFDNFGLDDIFGQLESVSEAIRS